MDDPTAGLPAALVRILRDPSIIVSQDAAVWELLASWRNAPSGTASADVTRAERFYCPYCPEEPEMDRVETDRVRCPLCGRERDTAELVPGRVRDDGAGT